MRKFFTILLGLSALASAATLTVGTAMAAKPQPWQLGLPEPVTPLAEDLLFFHNYWLMPIITVITVFVLVLLIYVCIRFRESANPVPSKTTHNTLLEVLWTGVPAIILFVLAFPSLSLLYKSDNFEGSEMTLKIIGHQWYWEYQYPDHGNFLIEARIAARTHEEAKELGVERLMDTDEEVVIPANTKIRLQMTASDVLHNWSVSDFGVRMDTVPGRLNEFPLSPVQVPGVYYGFCSELCGTDHAFMPIKVRVVPKDEFEIWAREAAETYDLVEGTPEANQKTDLAVSPVSAAE